MALSKRMKKILAGFFTAINRYEEAFERGDREAARALGKESVEYCEKYQKELKLSDECVGGMRTAWLQMEKDYAQEAYLEEQLKRIRRDIEEEERKLFDAVQKEDKRGAIKWN
jgi:ATP-dependent Lon protease